MQYACQGYLWHCCVESKCKVNNKGLCSLLIHVDISPIRNYINFLSVEFQKNLGNLPEWKYERLLSTGLLPLWTMLTTTDNSCPSQCECSLNRLVKRPIQLLQMYGSWSSII